MKYENEALVQDYCGKTKCFEKNLLQRWFDYQKFHMGTIGPNLGLCTEAGD